MKWLKSRRIWIPVGIMLVVLVGLFHLPWCGIVGGDEDLLASVPTSLLMLHLGPPSSIWNVPKEVERNMYGSLVQFDELEKNKSNYDIKVYNWKLTRWPWSSGEYMIGITILETEQSTTRIRFNCYEYPFDPN